MFAPSWLPLVDFLLLGKKIAWDKRTLSVRRQVGTEKRLRALTVLMVLRRKLGSNNINNTKRRPLIKALTNR